MRRHQCDFILFHFRHQIRTYTQQLVKDTDGILKDLVNNNNDRHLKIQRERLVDEFTTALTSFQVRWIFYLVEIGGKRMLTTGYWLLEKWRSHLANWLTNCVAKSFWNSDFLHLFHTVFHIKNLNFVWKRKPLPPST